MLQRIGRAKFLVPEVVQSSAMDCGPACLKAFLEGFGIGASYGRLREACQTGIDGTSIDAIEVAAVQLGLRAEQQMVPLDHLLLPESGSLPAIVVLLTAAGATHFVLLWRRYGSWLQVMDPAFGRQWVPAPEFLSRAYIHSQAVPADVWREWAGSDKFLDVLRRRMSDIGVSDSQQSSLLSHASNDRGWRSLAALDGAVRMASALVAGRGALPGAEAHRVVEKSVNRTELIPSHYYSVQPDPTDPDTLRMSGVVLLHAGGCDPAPRAAGLSPELAAALGETKLHPLWELWKMLRDENFSIAAVLAVTSVIAAAGVVCEALLFRGMLDIDRHLTLSGQRLALIATVLVFLVAMLLFEWSLAAGLLRLGRRLENQFRVRFLKKLPLLGDRYFQSRPMSDMAERAHSLHLLRGFPAWAEQTLRPFCCLSFTVLGISLLFPSVALLAVCAATVSVGVPLLAQPLLAERDLRRRDHEGALSLFYFDALRGLSAIRSHGAAFRFRRIYEERLGAWASAGLRFHRMSILVEGVQASLAFTCIIALLVHQIESTSGLSGLLLLVYWAISIPALAQEFAAALYQYPRFRSVALRLIEPLRTPEEERTTGSAEPARADGVEIVIDEVRIVAAGQTILDGVNLRVEPGEHVAIVGSSGAGKSTLLSLLLGWHRPSRGSVRVDGAILDTGDIERLRRQTAWIDPEVYLWNDSLFQNLAFGRADDGSNLEPALEIAGLREVLQSMPHGLQTACGEGGTFLSGGQGQRIRVGRALNRPCARLVILDEPLRGLERDTRRRIMRHLRSGWGNATLLCVTHDILETCQFPRVVVLDCGRIVEDGKPHELLLAPSSRYRGLFEASQLGDQNIWAGPVWRRFHMEKGQLKEEPERNASVSSLS